MRHPKGIHFLHPEELPRFSYSSPSGISVVMPCTDADLGMATARVLFRRAEIRCHIFVVLDNKRQGFIKTVNETAQRIITRYLVYLAQDAYPGRGWLRCAYETLEKQEKGLLAFNDGKWRGRIASFGMVRTDWVRTLYGGWVFYPGYMSHKADNELTVIARAQNMHVYNPECVLVEIDPNKDFGGSNPEDNALFKARFLFGFDGLAPLETVMPMAGEYHVKHRARTLAKSLWQTVSRQK